MPAKRTRVLAALTALCAVLSGSAVLGGSAVAGPLGPAPRGADGRFENQGGPLERGGARVFLPFFLRRVARQFAVPSGLPRVVPNDGAFLRANARHSTPTVTWVGHSTLLVQMDHVSFLTDPIWSKRASPLSFAGPRRMVPPGVALEDLPPIDFVLVSHNHYDHLDLDTLEALAERDPDTRFVVPLGNAQLLRGRGVERIEELDWGESLVHRGVRIHCLPAQHWSLRGLRDERRALWASWAVTGDERRFYFGGDTGYFPGLAAIGAALGPFDLAAVPIGAYLPVAMMKPSHLDPEEALQAGRELRARRALAVHFGTFELADEPLDEPPRRFLEGGRAAGYRPDEVWVLDIGETRPF